MRDLSEVKRASLRAKVQWRRGARVSTKIASRIAERFNVIPLGDVRGFDTCWEL
jgi:hypothetical protein